MAMLARHVTRSLPVCWNLPMTFQADPDGYTVGQGQRHRMGAQVEESGKMGKPPDGLVLKVCRHVLCYVHPRERPGAIE